MYTVQVEHHSELQSVRDFFLSSDEKTDISVEVASWETLDYAWLFDQFATKIRENIKVEFSTCNSTTHVCRGRTMST